MTIPDLKQPETRSETAPETISPEIRSPSSETAQGFEAAPEA